MRVWNWLTTVHMLWGDDNVNTELAADAATPTPAATEDVVPAALAVVDIC